MAKNSTGYVFVKKKVIICHENCLSVMTAVTLFLSSSDLAIVDT